MSAPIKDRLTDLFARAQRAAESMMDYELAGELEDFWKAHCAQRVEGAGVTDGYVLVPREPTEAMLQAALRLQGEDAFIAKAPALVSAFRKIYKAMLAAPEKGPREQVTP